MTQKWRYLPTGSLIIWLAAFTVTPSFAQQASAIVDSVTQVSSGRYRITGTALASDGNVACALALASGRCMFTCGPGSLRCEGGTANLPFGKFQLDYLPCETDGNIYLQVFVQGNISYTGRIPCGSPPSTAQWRVYNNTCCRDQYGNVYPVTYEVTIDGVTRRSVSNSCSAPSTNEGFASTTAGTKPYSSRVISQCGNATGGGSVSMAANSCYKFQLGIQSGQWAESVNPISCSLTVNTLQEESAATPMAIFPMQPTGDDSGSPNLAPSLKISP